MHRRWWVAAAMLAVVAIGCGKREETVTISTPDGTVTTSTSDGTVEVKGPDGTEAKVTEGGDKATYEGKDAAGNVTRAETGKGADMSGMDLPQYPGSTLKDDSRTKVETGGQTTFGMGLVTKDAPEKVLAWYKSRLTEVTTMSSGEGWMVMGKSKSGAQVHVTAAKEAAGTEITIVVMK